MRKAGRLAAETLDALIPHVVPGVTTQELDDIVRDHMLAGGGVPATLGYRGYPKSCCISEVGGANEANLQVNSYIASTCSSRAD